MVCHAMNSRFINRAISKVYVVTSHKNILHRGLDIQKGYNVLQKSESSLLCTESQLVMPISYYQYMVMAKDNWSLGVQLRCCFLHYMSIDMVF